MSLRNLAKISFFILMVALLTGCQATPSPQVVAPVTGLPQGTDGFPWWNDAVFYQVFIRSFMDSNADGIGDINGLMDMLDYLNDGDPTTDDDLGVTGIWLMPVHPSPSYHGYDVDDYYAINSQYGSMEDFKRFLEEARTRGIRVIIDLVMNHTAVSHPWFIEAANDPQSSRRDWYIWTETNPGYEGPWGQRVWYSTLTGYYYAIFWEGMPDLNYENQAVIAEMKNVAHFWLEEVGVDGFRLDAAKHIIEEGEIQENAPANHTWWQDFRSFYKGINPQAMALGEVWSSSDQVAKYLEGDQLDLAFDFDLAGAIISGVGVFSPRDIQNALTRSTRAYRPGQFATFLTNHDMNRAMNMLLYDPARVKIAATILLTAPGVPFIYYGEEIGMTGAKPDENVRTPMQWSGELNAGFTTASSPWRAVNPDYPEKNVALQEEDPQSLLSHYRSLIHLRNNHVALRIGDYLPVEASDRRLLAYLRTNPAETVLVLVNFNKEPLAIATLSLDQGPLSGKYHVVPLFISDQDVAKVKWQVLEADLSGGFADYWPLPEDQALPAGGALILQLQPLK